jgi:hypothetical protein
VSEAANHLALPRNVVNLKIRYVLDAHAVATHYSSRSYDAAAPVKRGRAFDLLAAVVMPGTQSTLRRLRKLVCAAGHPRLCYLEQTKTWMAGTSPAMTVERTLAGEV